MDPAPQADPEADPEESAAAKPRRSSSSKPRSRSAKRRAPETEPAASRERPGITGPTAEERLERARILEALEVGLMDALPGIELLDRDLRFDDLGQADLAAVDPAGRLVLVLVAGNEPDRTVLETLDVLAYARENATLLMRHLGSRRVNPGVPPRLVVIDPAADESLRRRLACLASTGVELYTLRNLTSAAGERSYLIAVAAPPAAEAFGEGGEGVQAFLDALPLPLREVGQELADRMARLDEELFASAEQSSLVWRFHGEVLARLMRDRDGLTVSVAPSHWPSPLREAPDVEGVLEDALACLAAELERSVEGTAVGPPSFARREPGPPSALAVAASEPILTPEEIEAFRE